MKYIIYVLFIGAFSFLNAQFQDDFSDGDFSSNPAWIGDTDSFEINATNELHLLAPANNEESYLSTVSTSAVNGYWEFKVDLDFNPSSTNKAYVYLISDQSDLENSLNGYFVMIGNTADEISLYRQDGTSTTEIIDGTDDFVDVSHPIVKVKVTRDISGNFELFADNSVLLNNYQSQGVVLDNGFMNSGFFGVRCDYTSSRSDKFIFDDFDVTAQTFVDIYPPTVTNFEIINPQSVILTFSEEISNASAQNVSNFSVSNSIGNPSLAVYDNIDFSTTLTFASSLQSGINYSIDISSIEDIVLNVLDTIFQFSLQNSYAHLDVVFNEILADESPSSGLPTFEFIEFKNLLNDTIYTNGWFLSDLTDTSYFPDDTILPNEYFIVCKTTAKTFYEGFGKTFGLSNFISLNNAEDKLTLYNQYGGLIDSLHYFEEWFRDELSPTDDPKVDGGWSLERISDFYPCSDVGNWSASHASIGGTPGEENSDRPMILGSVAPSIKKTYFLNDSTIIIQFDQEVTNGLNEIQYQFSYLANGVINDLDIISIAKYGSNSFQIEIGELYIHGNVYTVETNGIKNCAGVPAQNDISVIFYLKNPELGDLIINEILFNPFSESKDYVEIYNTTDFALDLNGFQITEYDIDDDTLIDMSTIISSDFVMEPNAYFTFTEDKENVLIKYLVEKGNWLFELNIPRYASNEGIVGLMYNGIVLDKLHYFSRWNFELLDSEKGVSLERISYNSATQDDNNWASAAEGFGFGTPTAKNSQTYPSVAQEDLISVSPEVFSPNQDGMDDFTVIQYTIDKPGFVATAAIYDAVAGRKIKDIATKETIGAEGFWKWDGTNYNGEKAKVGIYIVLIDLFDLEGNAKQFKKKIVLGY